MQGASECTLIQSQLQLYAGGELAADECAVVQAHLGRCSACGSLAQRACATRALIARAALDVGAEPPGLWPLVRQRLVQEGLLPGAAPAEPSFTRRLRLARAGMWTGLAAAAAVALWWFVWDGRGQGDPASGTPGLPRGADALAVVPREPASQAPSVPVPPMSPPKSPPMSTVPAPMLPVSGGLQRLSLVEDSFAEMANATYDLNSGRPWTGPGVSLPRELNRTVRELKPR